MIEQPARVVGSGCDRQIAEVMGGHSVIRGQGTETWH